MLYSNSQSNEELDTKMTILSKVIDNEQMEKITAEFSRLGERCYLENSGATLYPQCLLTSVNEDLTKNVYMNPHTDKYTKDCIEQIRCLILKHFNTDPSKYTVVFTSGTTQSLKLVVESFQFSSDTEDIMNCGSFMYLQDNHTSVLGLREIAAEKHADIIHISHDHFLEYLNPTIETPSTQWKEKYKNEGNTLLVYPIQSNFNGHKYPLNVINSIKEGCLNNYIRKNLCKDNCNWYVMLDAASYLPTNRLDLSKYEPDFVCLSFYKIFGYPTGLGALLIKNTSGNLLSEKKYFGGGTVDIVLTTEDFHVKRSDLQERLEDGTNAFLSILALKHCFDTMQYLIPKTVNNNYMDTISHHTFYLAQDLYQLLKSLRHKNGKIAAILYHDNSYTDIEKQGSVVTFNLVREDDTFIGYAEFQHIADLYNINVRTGCFCNSGSCQRHLNASNKDMKAMYKAGHKCGDEVDLVDGKPTGAVRVSYGYYNTYNDTDKLMQMICQCFVKVKYKQPRRDLQTYTPLESPELPKKELVLDEKHKTLLEQAIEEKHKMIYEKHFFRTVDIGPKHNPDMKMYLLEMAIFPVKSCGAFKVRSNWKIGAKGFEYDREWMIVKDNGVCLTQKQNSRMCLIRPVIDLKKKVLILTFKGRTPISIPLDPKKVSNTEISLCHSKVCTDIVKGVDCGDAVANWISEALEISFLRLVRQSTDDSRKVRDKKPESNNQKYLSLSNQAQFLLINKATVRWLSNEIQEPTFMDTLDELTDRFRGNIIIESDEELIETDWKRVIIGKHEFKVEGQCPRCQMVCIDQQTGEKSIEPLRTISEKFGGKLRFGVYLTYIGAVDGSKDRILKPYSPITSFLSEQDVSRFKDWFFTYFMGFCVCNLNSDKDIAEYEKYKKIL